MNQKTILLTFDLEEFVAPKEHRIPCADQELFRISIEGLTNLVALLDKHHIRATFFTTKTFAEHPEVKKILLHLIKNGHEIALHGNDHMDIYATMKEDELFTNLQEAKQFLEKTFKQKLTGFRAPRLQKVSFPLLKNLGFSYEASLHPTLVPGHYNNFFVSRKVQKKEIIQIPISVTPIFRAPFSWVWFRNFGLNYVKLCTFLTVLDSPFIQLYFHPWDFYDFQKNPVPASWKLPSFYFHNTGKATLMLETYILWLLKKKYTFKTVREYLS